MALGIALPVIDLRRLPLKLRVALACTGLGLVLSVLFSASTIFITERFESVIVKKLLESDGWDAGSGPRGNVERGSHGAPAASPLIRYVAKGGDRSRVPSELRDLPIGLQEFGEVVAVDAFTRCKLGDELAQAKRGESALRRRVDGGDQQLWAVGLVLQRRQRCHTFGRYA